MISATLGVRSSLSAPSDWPQARAAGSASAPAASPPVNSRRRVRSMASASLTLPPVSTLRRVDGRRARRYDPRMVRTRRFSRVEYERLIDLGVFQPDESLELIGGELIVAEPQGAAHYTAIVK